MPISSPAAGTDAAFVSPGGRSGLTLDYHARDRGPSFRRALQEASAPSPAAVAVPVIAGPAADAGIAPAGEVYEGTDALSQLRRDLFSGGAILVDAPPPTAAAASPADAVPVDTVAAIQTAPAGPDRPADWRNDEVKGRRLGDRSAAAEGGDGVEAWLFGEDGFGFDDLIDVVNPLQHIPIVSSLYRWITGDEIAPAATVAGGALFGGPLGLAGAVASVAIEEATGRDLGREAVAMIFGDGADEGADQVADATSLAATPTPGLTMGGDQGATPLPVLPAAIPATMPPTPEQLAAASMPRRDAAATPAAATGAPILFIPAPAAGSPGNEPAAAPAAAPSPADAAIAAQMKLALDKYEALTRQRAAAMPPAAGGPAVPASGSLFDGRL